jgi:hypothetical protein
MALKALLDSLEGLSDSDQAHYSKVSSGVHAGKFRADITAVSGEKDGKKWSLSLDDVGGLRSSLEDRRGKHEKAQALLDKLKDADGNVLDAKKYSEAITKLASLEGAVDKDKVEEIVKSRLVEREKKFNHDVAERDAKIATVTKQLSNVVVRGSAISALLNAKIPSEQVELLLPHVVERLGINSKGEMPTAFVKGENGNARISLKSGAGSEDLMQPDELVEEMSTMSAFAPAFPGSGQSGSGAPASSGGASGVGGAVKLTRDEASQPKRYQAAKAEAAKRGVPLQVD